MLTTGAMWNGETPFSSRIFSGWTFCLDRVWKFEGRVSSPRGWARLSEPGLAHTGWTERDGGKEKARRDWVRRREGKGWREGKGQARFGEAEGRKGIPEGKDNGGSAAKGCIGDLALRPEMDAALFLW